MLQAQENTLAQNLTSAEVPEGYDFICQSCTTPKRRAEAAKPSAKVLTTCSDCYVKARREAKDQRKAEQILMNSSDKVKGDSARKTLSIGIREQCTLEVIATVTGKSAGQICEAAITLYLDHMSEAIPTLPSFVELAVKARKKA